MTMSHGTVSEEAGADSGATAAAAANLVYMNDIRNPSIESVETNIWSAAVRTGQRVLW